MQQNIQKLINVTAHDFAQQSKAKDKSQQIKIENTDNEIWKIEKRIIRIQTAQNYKTTDDSEHRRRILLDDACTAF